MYAPIEYKFLDNPVESNALDSLLAVGYFRTGNYMLKTRVLLYNEYLYNLFHIRYNLKQYEFSKSMRKLIKKNKDKFYATVQPFKNSIEKENLFWHHRQRFSGSRTLSLQQYLFDYDDVIKFNTYEINIYDKNTNKLVAYSIFDKGSNSIASILGIFDNAYANYSLGIYSMLLEIEYAQDNQFVYYYPGYVADKPSPFNYKLRLGKNPDYYDWFSLSWRKLEDIESLYKLYDYYNEQLDIAEKWLKEYNINYVKTKHPYYYMKYYYKDSNCLSSIEQLLILHENFDKENVIIEYNAAVDKIVISAIQPHYLEQEIDMDNLIEDNVWKNLMLYVHPNYYLERKQDLIHALIQIKRNLANNNS